MKSLQNKNNKILYILSLIASLFILCSCEPNQEPKITLGDSFWYWEADAGSTPGDAMKHFADFKKLEDKSTSNLLNVLGPGSRYVWVMAQFEIPEYFRNQPLGLVIPYLRFAGQVYCNGSFISQYGNFPPNEQSTLFKAHFFSFPLNVLKQEGQNTILIKIYAQGKSGISSHSFIQPARFAYPAFEVINFHHTRIYMPLTGSLLLTFILYICFYLSARNFTEFKDFAFLNIFTAMFVLIFFATELPVYTGGIIPFLLFTKFTLCIPVYFMVYFATAFAVDFHHKTFSLPLRIFRISILTFQTLLTAGIPSYNGLIKIAPYMLALLFIQILTAIIYIIKLFIKKEKRAQTLYFVLAMIPFITASLIDVIARKSDESEVYPYYSIFGWSVTTIIFIIMLAIRFSRTYKRNQRLTNHLQEEVDSRTSELKTANARLNDLNEQLEKDKKRLVADLEMASIVQKNFFSHPAQNLKNWDISTWYEPLSKVSGDFYDYFTYNNVLNGLSIFDVSGHGISASLVTMLSKNIISGVFQKGFRNNVHASKILSEINTLIIKEKGDIQNYMTGILCRFNEDRRGGFCRAELGNAGHPYPLKYSAENKEIYELKGNDGKDHYGAIGMSGIQVSFAQSNFTMKDGDILVLFTDGISEINNSKGEQYGTGDLMQIVRQNSNKTSAEILSIIKDHVKDFTKDSKIDDDITVIIAKRDSSFKAQQTESGELLEEL
ncbi:MAG: SpoIIE family protein phosphatase [Treponema sp.]|nr:SpoIIE family protein phosphatase [Treponema sp.]